MKSSTLIVLVAAVVLGLAAIGNAMTLQVEPKVSECFYQHFDEGKGVKFFWQVVRGGLLDILVQVRYEGDRSPGEAARMVHEKLHFEGEGEGIVCAKPSCTTQHNTTQHNTTLMWLSRHNPSHKSNRYHTTQWYWQ
jgi:hypothetical protein